MLWPLTLSIVLFEVASFFLIIATLWLVVAVINYLASEIVVTNRRLSLQTGVLCRGSLRTSLDSIRDVNVEHGPVGRALGYGTLVITLKGGSMHRFSPISKTFEFKKVVERQIQPV